MVIRVPSLRNVPIFFHSLFYLHDQFSESLHQCLICRGHVQVGPWNQAYMYDTLPNKLSQEEMQPGDLVFVEGRYFEKHNRTPMHGDDAATNHSPLERFFNVQSFCVSCWLSAWSERPVSPGNLTICCLLFPDIVHVEIWTGRGPNGRGTIGARRQVCLVFMPIEIKSIKCI
jgi:hypothetical protein